MAAANLEQLESGERSQITDAFTATEVEQLQHVLRLQILRIEDPRCVTAHGGIVEPWHGAHGVDLARLASPHVLLVRRAAVLAASAAVELSPAAQLQALLSTGLLGLLECRACASQVGARREWPARRRTPTILSAAANRGDSVPCSAARRAWMEAV